MANNLLTETKREASFSRLQTLLAPINRQINYENHRARVLIDLLNNRFVKNNEHMPCSSHVALNWSIAFTKKPSLLSIECSFLANMSHLLQQYRH